MRPYTVITPARDEGAHIRHTLESMAAQTVRPVRWVIVSDGSTDNTDAVVQEFTAQHDWIELITAEASNTRHFGSKVAAFNKGLEQLAGVEYDAIACVDADISFPPDYFEFLLAKLEEDPKLGLVGTEFTEENYDSRKDRAHDDQHVTGACQVFRRQCFDDIGGYKQLPIGGIDLAAEITARYKGWKTRSFSDMTFFHHKPMGAGTRGALATKFNYGYRDYYFSNHPLFQLARIVFQMTRAPYIIGGILIALGYTWGHMTHPTKALPPNVAAFRRAEQLARLGLRKPPRP